MFYVIENKDIAAFSKTLIEIKQSKIKNAGSVVLIDREPTDKEVESLRWLDSKPEPAQTKQHSDKYVIQFFQEHGGVRQGAKENYRVDIDGTLYTVKDIDGRLSVSLARTSQPFPITGIQPGSEL